MDRIFRTEYLFRGSILKSDISLVRDQNDSIVDPVPSFRHYPVVVGYLEQPQMEPCGPLNVRHQGVDEIFFFLCKSALGSRPSESYPRREPLVVEKAVMKYLVYSELFEVILIDL